MLESVKLAWYAWRPRPTDNISMWRPRNIEQLRRENAELREAASAMIVEVEEAHKLMREYTERLASILDVVEKKSGENK